MQHEPPPEAPVPTGAEQSGPSEVTVMFDQPLADGPLDASNWAAAGGIAFPAVSATAMGSAVVVTTASSGTFDQVSYSPPPFDVVAAATGEPAVGFVLGV